MKHPRQRENVLLAAGVVTAVLLTLLGCFLPLLMKNTPDTPPPSCMTDTEKRLSAILSTVEGAGETSVYITSRAGPAAQNTFSALSFESPKDTADDGQIIDGVLIVSAGGRNASVANELRQSAAAALGISASKIYVTAMTDGK